MAVETKKCIVLEQQKDRETFSKNHRSDLKYFVRNRLHFLPQFWMIDVSGKILNFLSFILEREQDYPDYNCNFLFVYFFSLKIDNFQLVEKWLFVIRSNIDILGDNNYTLNTSKSAYQLVNFIIFSKFLRIPNPVSLGSKLYCNADPNSEIVRFRIFCMIYRPLSTKCNYCLVKTIRNISTTTLILLLRTNKYYCWGVFAIYFVRKLGSFQTPFWNP